MDSRRNRLLRAALAVALPLGVLGALFPGAVFRGESFYASDLGGFHRPIRSLLLRLAHESSGLPVWNPYLALGQPYAANPHYAVFHPTTALFFLLPFETAFRLQVLLPVLAAFGAMVFFLRTLRRSFAASLFGGLCWAFGGSFLSGTILLPIALTLAPMPATLAFAVRLTRARERGETLRSAAGCALSFGLQCLAGEPGSLFITMGLGAVALLEALRREEDGNGADPARDAAPPAHRLGRGAVRLVLAFALGIGIAGAALLPGAALGARSSRALPGGIPESGAALWSMPPARLAEIVFPRSFGYLERQWDEDGWYWGASSYPGRGRPFLFSLYAGSLAAALAAAGFAHRARRLAGWAAAAVLGALLALGPAGLLWTAARRVLPLFANVRYPERWILVTTFVVAVASAFGFDALREGRAWPRRIVVGVLGALGIAAVGAAFAARAAGGGQGAWYQSALGMPPAVAAAAGPVLARDLMLAAMVALAGAVAAALVSRAPRPAPKDAEPTERAAVTEATRASSIVPRRAVRDVVTSAAVVALFAIAALDLVRAFRPFALTDAPEVLGVPPPAFQPLIAQKPEGPIFHYAAYDRKRAFTEDRAAPPLPALWGLATTLEEDFDISELAWSRRATVRFFEASVSDPALVGPLLARRGVAAIVRVRAPAAPSPDGGGAIEILRPNGSLPFLVCVEQTEPAAGEEGWLAAVRRLGDRAARTAVVDPRDAPGVPAHPLPCEATLVERTPVRILADVRASAPGGSFLAIDQTWDRYWRASIDGVDTTLLRTDLALSALLVPPGPHRVELVYRDPWIARGALVSVVSLALCGILVVAASRRV